MFKSYVNYNENTSPWINYYYHNNNNPSCAVAYVEGGPLRPEIQGAVWFKDVPGGTEVCAEIYGLPPYRPATNGQSPIGPHGFHIHEYGSCEIGKSVIIHENPDDYRSQPAGNSGKRLACGEINWYY